MEKFKILIYEDNRQLRESLVGLFLLHDEFTVVGSFENTSNVLSQIAELKPSLIFMDIDMGESNGIDAVKKIRAAPHSTPVIMLTVFDDNDNIFNALYAGANGFLLKKHAAEKLVPAAYEALQGGGPMSPSIAGRVLQHFFHSTDLFPKYNLTRRETETLSLMAAGNSYKLIAAELNISIDTVRAHVKHIYEKLHVNSQTEAVSKAFREKLI